MKRLQINDKSIAIRPRETLLQAALRSGVDFPNSCRVGGCGACKCKLVAGAVRELTETGYLLSEEELDQGTILACQSVPRGDVRIEVDLAPRGTAGRIIAQDKLTHDITRLTVELEETIEYRAGQFANLRLEGLEGVVRSYSFASPSNDRGQVEFVIRRVPGGRFSPMVNDEDLIDRRVYVDTPAGDFWLRPGDTPLLFVAGGSGLAPILAILREALDAGVSRSATLLFGARQARDLYALDEIRDIATRWQGEFNFIPALSEADDEDSWEGARGLVTDQIEAHLEEGSHAYVCGPPPMVDAARTAITALGVSAANVHFDRFTTQADAATTETQFAEGTSTAGLFQYVKYFSFHLIGLLSLAALFAGTHYITAGFLAVLLFYILGDAVAGDDDTTPSFKYPRLLTAQLWMALPLLTLIVFAAVWSVSRTDIFGIGAWLQQLTGYDVLAARSATTIGHHLSGALLTGLMIGMIGTIPAHELTHRTWDPISLRIGRALLAFSFDTIFAIEHVYGHHQYVSTTHDPATAPRGRNVYAHIVISTLKGNRSAWDIEADRLRKKRLPIFSRHNAFIRGHLMSLSLVVLAFALGGWVAAGYFLLCALLGKALLEIVNYMEHYGMVRNPATPVQPRHSWNTNRRISSWALFNLTRHSHHHAQGEVPFHELRPYPDAPMMVSGYLTTLLLTLIPPVWNRLMIPKLIAWDREFATEEERALAAVANERSGIPALMEQSAPSPAILGVKTNV
jgi:NAD(P)H-flavin reductase/ferredoxin